MRPVRTDQVTTDKMLRMAHAFANAPAPKARRKNSRHTRTRGYIEGLEEALRLGSAEAIEQALKEARARLAAKMRA